MADALRAELERALQPLPGERPQLPERPRYKPPGKGGLFQWLALQRQSEPLPNRGSLPWDEIRKHNVPEDCWMVLRGAVYDITAYLPYHPGGVDELLRGAGRDATFLFDEVHSWVNIEGFLSHVRVGTVEAAPTMRRTLAVAQPTPSGTFETAELTASHYVTHNTKLLTFTLPQPLRYVFGQHVKVQLSIRGRLHQRPYTPLTPPGAATLQLLVKEYRDGEVSPALCALAPGAALKFKLCGAPAALLPQPAHLCVVAAGVGVAPFVPILVQALAAPAPPRLTLVLANAREEDMLLRTFADALRDRHGAAVHYFLSSPPAHWEGESGRLTGEKLRELIPKPSTLAMQVLLCGPVRMVNGLSADLLASGYSSSQVVPFV